MLAFERVMLNWLYCSKPNRRKIMFRREIIEILTCVKFVNVWGLAEEFCDDDKWANDNKSDADLFKCVDDVRHWSTFVSIDFSII